MGSEFSNLPREVLQSCFGLHLRTYDRHGSLDSREVDLPGLNAFVCLPF